MAGDRGPRRGRRAGVVLLSVLFSASGSAWSAAAQEAVPLTPAQGRAGTSVTTGTQLPEGSSTCVVEINGAPVAADQCRWDDSGEVDAVFVVPDEAAPGAAGVTFREALSDPDGGPNAVVGSATFTVLAVAPDVVGGTVDAAAEQLDAAGLVLGVVTPEGAAADAAVVVQAPAAGTELPAGSAVDVQVATDTGTSTPDSPDDLVTVPPLLGLTLEEASAAVDSSLQVVGPAGRAGPVTSQRPQAGTRVARGTVVRVRIRNASEPPVLDTDRGRPLLVTAVVGMGVFVVGVVLLRRPRRARVQRAPVVRIEPHPDPVGHVTVDPGERAPATLRIRLVHKPGRQTLEEV